MTTNVDGRILLLKSLAGALLVAVVAQTVIIVGMHRPLTGPIDISELATRPSIPRGEKQQGHGTVRPSQSSPVVPDPFGVGMDDWDFFKEMQAMHDQINHMFGSEFNRFQYSDDFSDLFRNHAFSPDINVEDKGDRVLMKENES